jgi:hypothetical protein
MIAAELLVIARPAFAIVSASADVTAGANGDVRAIVQVGNRVYLGGLFSWVGPITGSGVPVNSTTGTRIVPAPARFVGSVKAARPDGSGGWFVGGDFTQVAGQARNRLARISSTGTLTSWNPGANGTVNAIAVSGGVVYLGGSFSSVGGQSRSNLAAITTAGVLTSWNPDANGPVQSLEVSPDGTTIYVGGSFSNVGGANRANVAALSTAGVATSWNPGTDGAVRTLETSPDGATVYVGGSFGTLGGATRSNLGAVSSGGAVSGWNPGADGTVRALVARSNVVFAGGDFAAAGGDARSHIAAVDAVTGAATSWNPGADGIVRSLDQLSDGSAIYAAGDFRVLGGAERDRAGAIDRLTGVATAWNPGADAIANVVARSNSQMFVGGDFTMLNGAARSNLAALDATTGEVDRGWRADTNGFVYALASAPDGSSVYAGGAFTQVGGQTRTNLARVDGATGAVLTGVPSANNTVRALVLGGNRLYVGGALTSLGPVNTGRLGAVNLGSGTADTAFKPKPNGSVRTLSLTPDGSALYAGGGYTTIGGVARAGIASLNPLTAAVSSWNPTVNGIVIASAVSPDGDQVYFSTSSNRLWAFPTTGTNTPVWQMHTGGDVQCIAASSTTVYVGGHFTNIPDLHVARVRLAAFTPSGELTSWAPGTNGSFGSWTMALGPNALWIGGDFTRVSGRLQPGIARFSGTP